MDLISGLTLPCLINHVSQSSNPVSDCVLRVTGLTSGALHKEFTEKAMLAVPRQKSVTMILSTVTIKAPQRYREAVIS